MKMYSQFGLFQSHLDLAHHYWSALLLPHKNDAIAIDATCGNGHDTAILAKMIAPQNLYAIDIQPIAIETTKQLLSKEFNPEYASAIKLFTQCHSTFPANILPETVSLIVYNLGYLPGGEKLLTTRCQTTLESLSAASKLIKYGGAISITCYPGHAEGKLEEDAILDFAATLSPREWSCCHHRWMNRRNSPSLLLIQRRT